MYYFSKYHSPIGECLIVADQENLAGVWFVGQKYYCPIHAELIENRENTVIKNTVDWLERYFAGERSSPSELPLKPIGSVFQQEVWEILLQIPYGRTMTYGEIAKRIAVKTGKVKMSAQAVGGAVGRNPILMIIPCHRVVGANGNLTGYAGGISKKRWLLDHEGVDVTCFTLPVK